LWQLRVAGRQVRFRRTGRNIHNLGMTALGAIALGAIECPELKTAWAPCKAPHGHSGFAILDMASEVREEQ